MRRLPRAISTLFILMAALTIAACGGDDGGNTDTATIEVTDTTPTAVELAFDRPAAITDPFNDPSGPFFHQVVRATSSDGIDFTAEAGVVIDKASVPDAIRMPDGRLIIYAVDGGGRSESGMLVAVSDDDGETWEQGSLQVEYSGDHRSGADPDAVVLEDGTVRLYYIVFPEQMPPVGAGEPVSLSDPVRVMSSTSADGISFTEDEGIRVESSEFITDPDVVEIDGQWYMYLSQDQTNLAYTSEDGVDFYRVGAVRSDGAVSNTVSIGGGWYRQFFCRQGISSAATEDGVIFIDDPGVRIAEAAGMVACDPAPVKLEDGWLMFYKVGPKPQGRPADTAAPPPDSS